MRDALTGAVPDAKSAVAAIATGRVLALENGDVAARTGRKTGGPQCERNDP